MTINLAWNDLAEYTESVLPTESFSLFLQSPAQKKTLYRENAIKSSKEIFRIVSETIFTNITTNIQQKNWRKRNYNKVLIKLHF